MYNDYFYIADLTGSQEVPPVSTDADGITLFHVSSDKENIRFRLEVDVLNNMTQAHIHAGSRNINGPIVAFLFGPLNQVSHYTDKVIEGYITAKDLVGPLKGKSIRELIDLMSSRKAYVNVHTALYPDGEIPGKITHQ
ncbi:CHRD domain-containing protein [Oceanobacillus damuensis]|uniref:CHRD domain-containing protein n=1 Tax=Oceanobacillus damuensis TaxID=937928 RepID=UPI000833420F|nr:CHRD domain-containing protein [Oceanobacillus damuensis]